MRRPLTIALTLALLAGCGGNWSNEDLLFLAALPDRSQLESKLPGTGTAQQALTRDMSDIYLSTRDQSRAFNDGLFGMLTGFERMQATRPRVREPELRVWGPFPFWQDRRFIVRLVVRREPASATEELRFVYALEARRADSPGDDWTGVITGMYGAAGGIRRGVGALVFDIDQLRGLGIVAPDLANLARIEMGYDTSGWPLQVGLRLVPVDIATGALDYGYLEGEDGGGVLMFVIRKDLAEGPGIETLSIAAGWLPGGDGRALVRIEDGDAPPGGVGHEECWDESGRLTYRRDWLGREEGEVSACPAVEPPEPGT